MAGRTFHIFNPKENEWSKGRRFPCRDPDGFDPMFKKGPSPEVKRVLRGQKASGLWDWGWMPLPTNIYPELVRFRCAAVVRDCVCRLPGATDDADVVATLAIVVALTRAYSDDDRYFHDAICRAKTALGNALKLDADQVSQLIRDAYEEIKQRWLSARSARSPRQEPRERPKPTEAASKKKATACPVAKAVPKTKKQRPEALKPINTEGDAGYAARLNAARLRRLPILRWRKEGFAQVKGEWRSLRSGSRVNKGDSATLSRMWAQNRGQT